MEIQNRGRSPSVGHHPDQRINSSPSPHSFTGHISPTNLNGAASNQTFSSQSYSNNNLSPSTAGGIPYSLSGSYFDTGAQQPQFQQPQHVLPSNDFDNQAFEHSLQQNGMISDDQHVQSHLNMHPSNQQFQSDTLELNSNFAAFTQQQNFSGKQTGFSDNTMLLDPQLQEGMQQQSQSVNPAEIMENGPPSQTMVGATPDIMHLAPQHSEPTSPFTNAGQEWSPNHSRHTSLDPSAMYTNGHQQDWSGMLQGPQFQGHRRAPSEHSDVSSSVAPSPFIAQPDGFDAFEQNPSPMLSAQHDNQLYQEGLGIENFTISDIPRSRHSPRHSPFVSPRMSPQPGMGMAQDASFMTLPEAQINFNGALGPEGYGNQTEQFPTLPPEQRLPSNDYGQADQYDVPQISVEPAPATRQPTMEHARSPTDMDALSPPERGKKDVMLDKAIVNVYLGRKSRTRAMSDTYISRPVTPSSTKPTLGSSNSSMGQRNHSLSPHDNASFSPNGSRSNSPASRSPSLRRSSTSSVPNNRDYILELADPNRPPAPGTEKKVQKHPATFSCHLCPKKFTRAYNLRSHLRTHTDERPFVCTICNKAFARQHDRKRHEGLHSGEKKFVCRGELGTGATWGCGRRFARADALGRHFRSEAGRVCIKPLLDEEAMERQRVNDQMMNQQMAQGGIAPQAPMNGMGMQQQFAFPAALLQQFPALQGLQWDQMGAGDDEELNGRSSFDASSGAEYYDDDDVGSGYNSDNLMGVGFDSAGGWQHDQGWKSNMEERR
ncbi:MAG: hypothetical protein Q9164_006491 [Protoblastenia rupestris]